MAVIYLDNHSTTPLDPLALAAMLPLFNEHFANAGSTTHAAGRAVAEQVEQAIASMSTMLGASPDELVMTSGATESNNLALFGTGFHPRATRRKLVSVRTEHKALLDPLARLAQHGFQVELVNVLPHPSPWAGLVDMEALRNAIDEQTLLVSVMLANNETGVIQPLAEIAQLCRQAGCWLHTDASQAVGRMQVNVDELDVDLLSFSAHKFYGPKGVGGLFVRRRERRVRLQAQIVGGGQQHNFRSGTLNAPGIIGMQAAWQSCLGSLEADRTRIADLRDQLFSAICQQVPHVQLNGPSLQSDFRDLRLPGNLNCSFFPYEGQSLMLAMPDLAVSSGSACTSATPEPSHVLQAIGRSEEEARSSLRFGIGRFNTLDEIKLASGWIGQAAAQLSQMKDPT